MQVRLVMLSDCCNRMLAACWGMVCGSVNSHMHGILHGDLWSLLEHFPFYKCTVAMQWSCSVCYTILHKHVCCVTPFYLQACASICHKSPCQSFFPSRSCSPLQSTLYLVSSAWPSPTQWCSWSCYSGGPRQTVSSWPKATVHCRPRGAAPASWLWADLIGNAV